MILATGEQKPGLAANLADGYRQKMVRPFQMEWEASAVLAALSLPGLGLALPSLALWFGSSEAQFPHL